MKRIAIIGYFGMGNFGDDLMLYYLVNHILGRAPEIEINVFYCDNGSPDVYKTLFSKNRRLTYYKRGNLKNFFKIVNRCDALVFGGGTCFHEGGVGAIEYFLIAKLLCVRTLYLGIGIGRINSLKRRLMIRAALLFANVATFRDRKSLNMAKQLLPFRKRSFLSVADLAYLGTDDIQRWKCKHSNTRYKSKTLLLSWRDFESWEVKYDHINTIVDHLCKGLKVICLKHDINSIRLMPLCALVDNNIHELLLQHLNMVLHKTGINVSLIHNKNLFEQLSEISRNSVFISARMHGLIVGKIMGIPTVGFNYSPKVEAFAKDINHNCIIQPNELFDNFQIIEQKVDEALHVKAHKIDLTFWKNMHQSACKNIDILFSRT